MTNPRVAPAALRLPAPVPGPMQLKVGRLTRTYRVHRPQAVEDRPPLVVVLHGGFGSGEQAERAYHWNDQADAAGFVVCHPDGLMRAWNAGTCCGEPMRRGIDDVTYLAALLDRLGAEEAVDPDRVYVTGISNGAMMAYRLAAELPGRLAAIGPVAGTMCVRVPDERRALSICHVHGLEDHSVPFHGGRGSRALSQDWRRAVPEVIAEWRRVTRCGPAEVSDQGPVRIETATGTSGSEVALVTIRGAGHQWPGSAPPPARVLRSLRMDPPSQAVDATTLLWAFFAAHPRADA